LATNELDGVIGFMNVRCCIEVVVNIGVLAGDGGTNPKLVSRVKATATKKAKIASR
jgi:hypothetical protein